MVREINSLKGFKPEGWAVIVKKLLRHYPQKAADA